MSWSIMYVFIFLPLLGSAQITYYKDIASIIEKNCQACHSQGNIAPMSLTTYNEVSSYASMIKFVTDTKLMPPFKANFHKVNYENERSITKEEKELIAKWIDEGLSEGQRDKPQEQSEVVMRKEFDYSICMSESFEHYGIYYDQYQVFVLPTELSDGKFIKDIFFEPGNKEIVRSANISVAPKGAASKMDQWDPRYGYFAYGGLGFLPSLPNWYSWVPNSESHNLKKNERLYLPSESDLLLHIHYGPFGEIQKDSSCLHFVYDEISGPTLQNIPFVHTALLADTFLIERGERKRISTSFTIPIDTKLKSITPLAHLLCKSWEVFAVLPDKTSIPLLSIDDWDFHWKEKYVFENLINLPSGSRIHASAYYDNTTENPYNPAGPPHTMKKGPHMFDENFECYFEFGQLDSNIGYLIKPFSVIEKDIKELSFYMEQDENVTIQIHNIGTEENQEIESKEYKKGYHTLKSSRLPSAKGRYVISLVVSDEIIDTWWFIII